MQISQLLKKGEFHETFCEDFAYHTEINESLYLAAVLDGCSMGTDSHFASALYGKLIKRASKELGYRAMYGEIDSLTSLPLAKIGEEIIRSVKEGLREAANKFHLEQLEILSTINLAIVDTQKGEAWAIIIGDGIIASGGKIIIVEQNNRPNYLAYHLATPFEEWYPREKNRFEFNDISELTISTDGIGSFEPLEKGKPLYSESIEAYLLHSRDFEDSKRSFEKKISKLQKEYGLIGTDDIGIIRMKW